MTTTTTQAPAVATTNRQTVAPKVDIYDSQNEITLYAEMPGVDENSIDISLENNLLTIAGQASTPEMEGYAPYQIESAFPNYERNFKIHELIDQDQISATLKDGVLKLQLPKSQRVRQKKIEVKKI
ncbi:MAG: Hsp20/alpha crystallin family protein [Planctomycetaceae bacterium]